MRDFVYSLFNNNPLIWGPIFAIVLFSLMFIFVCARVIMRGKKAYEADARLPLEDGHE